MTQTLGEALAHFYDRNGLSPNQAEARHWTCGVGPVLLRFPNFAWRRKAIQRHDLHHVLTGYPCTMPGEIQMAAWEFGAGRHPHIASTLFCLPLVAAGVAVMPRRTYRAFARGRVGRTLYDQPEIDQLLGSPTNAARTSLAPPAGTTSVGDVLAFVATASTSWFLALIPLAFIAAAILILAR